MSIRRTVPLFAIALAAASCSDNYVNPPLVKATIDASGGTIEIAGDIMPGARIEIPPGALDQPTEISITTGFASSHAGFRVAGRGARVEPQGLRFALPVQVVLPYDDTTTNISMLLRDPAGNIVELGPTSVPDQAFVSVDTTALGIFWAAERRFGGVSTFRFLPLGDGNSWSFDSDVNITMTLTPDEPNLGGMPVYRMLFELGQENFGLYVQSGAPGTGEIQLLGEFSTAGNDSYQQLHDPTLFVPGGVTVGQPMEADFAYTGYSPFGATAVTASGVATEGIEPGHVEEIVAPADTYTGLTVIRTQTTFRGNDGTARVLNWSLTLARNVGPVAVEAFGTTGLLNNAMVGGRMIGQ